MHWDKKSDEKRFQLIMRLMIEGYGDDSYRFEVPAWTLGAKGQKPRVPGGYMSSGPRVPECYPRVPTVVL